MFVCSLFYLLEYFLICQKGPISRTLESEHPNVIFQIYANVFCATYTKPTDSSLLCIITLTKISERKVEGGELQKNDIV